MSKFRVRTTYKAERYCGDLTGRMYFTCETIYPADGLGAVLGRGYTERQAVDDFIFRAKQDGAKIEYRDLALVERKNEDGSTRS